MLNEYWAAVVPVIDAAGGIIEHFAGDGVMAIFNAAGDQPDHARRAARAGLAIVAAVAASADGHPGWPMFRIGDQHRPGGRRQRRGRRRAAASRRSATRRTRRPG